MSKSEFRQIAAEKVCALSADEKREKSRAVMESIFGLQEFKEANNILFYYSLNNEVETADAIKKAAAQGKNVYLPRVPAESAELEFCKVGDCSSELQCGCFGIMEPKPKLQKETDKGIVDVVIVPGVVFDSDCGRIGRGKGYYDRFLADVPAIKIGAAFDVQLTEKIPAREHDVLMDYVVTESRVLKRKLNRTGD